jgi:hypothetical protein
MVQIWRHTKSGEWYAVVVDTDTVIEAVGPVTADEALDLIDVGDIINSDPDLVDEMNSSSLNYVPVDQQLLTNARCERA